MPTSVSSLIFLQYLTSVFDNIDEAILLFGIEPNDQFRLLLTNAAFNKSTGRVDDITGNLAHEVLVPEAYKALAEHSKKVIKTKRQTEFVGWFNVPLGRQAFEIKLIPILNTVGECAQIAAITKNVTELYELRAGQKSSRVR